MQLGQVGADLGLNAQELAALDKLTEAINAIRKLPECHPAEQREMAPHFHAIQQAIMARAAVRAHPDVCTASEGFR